jgi:hypothetical protein
MTGSTVRTRLHLAAGAAVIGALLSACNGSDSSGTASTAQAAALRENNALLVEYPDDPIAPSVRNGIIVRSWGSPLAGPAGYRELPGSSSASGSGSATGSGASGAGAGGSVNTSGTVTLAWDPPTENTNGTALSDLAGFMIHYGTQSQTYTNTIQITNPGVTRYVVENLPAGTYYFAVTAYTTDGEDSAYSPQVSATVD